VSPWQELGIAPTDDESAIRRAYAVRLKRTRPEDDPEGFRRLRTAYEAALAITRYKQQRVGVRSPPAERPIVEPPAPPDKPPQKVSTEVTGQRPDQDPLIELDPAAEAARQTVISACDKGRGESAAQALADARARNLLPLATEIEL
jgi:hypothetical protein